VKKKDILAIVIPALVGLITGLALAYATYLAPAHAEERKYQLEQERLTRQKQMNQLYNPRPLVRTATKMK
jgi:hypothetical protein